MRKLFAALIFALVFSAPASAQFRGSLFAGPEPTPSPVEVASRGAAFTQKLILGLQGPSGGGPGPNIVVASRIVVRASYPTGTRGNIFISSSTGVPYACKSATCLANGTGWVSMDASGATTSPGGSNTQVQFNDSGAFGGSSGLTFNKSTLALTVGGALTVSGNVLPDAATRDIGSSVAPYSTVHVRGAIAFDPVSGNGNSLSFTDGAGPKWTDGNVGFSLTHNLQSLSANRTAVWPNANVTVAGANSTATTVPVLSSTAGVYSDSSITVVSNNVGVGLGSATPPTMFTVGDTSSSSPRGLMSWQASADTNGARLGFRKNRGTFAVPTTIVSGDTVGRLVAWPYDGTGWLEMGSIAFESTGTIATNRTPTQIVFKTATDAAPSVLTTALTLGADQSAAVAGILKAGSGPTTLTDSAGKILSAALNTVAVAQGGTGASSASVTAFNNITGYTASGATGTTSTNLVFSTSPALTTPSVTTGINDANSNQAIGLTATTSAVNSINVTNAASGGSPSISAVGSGTNVGINLNPKGNSPVSVNFANPGVGGVGFYINTVTTGYPALNFQIDGVLKALFGVPRAAGDLVGGSAVNDFAIRSQGGSIVFSTNSGSSIAVAVSTGGNLNINGGSLGFGSATAPTAGVNGSTAKVVAASDGTTANAGWFTDAGSSRVSTQFDKTDTTLANVTGLTVNVQAGRTYFFRAVLHLTLDATGGQKVAIAGTCTATSIIYQVNSVNNSTNLNVINSRQTALAGAASAAGGTADFTTIEGTITVANAGTLTVQFSESAATGTGSVLVGSVFIVRDTP